MSGSHEAKSENPDFHEAMVTAPANATENSLNFFKYSGGMKHLAFVLFISGCMASAPLIAAENTWSGTITDSMCTKDHSMMTKETGKDAAKKCTLACIKAGMNYVFVSDGKVYEIANQKMPDLKTYAGDSVKLTGDLQSDGKTIQIARLEAAK